MTTSTLKKFLVLYLVPTTVMAEWVTTDPATRRSAEEKMQAEWGRWMGEHAKMITLTQAATHAAAAAFANHPHLYQ